MCVSKICLDYFVDEGELVKNIDGVLKVEISDVLWF